MAEEQAVVLRCGVVNGAFKGGLHHLRLAKRDLWQSRYTMMAKLRTLLESTVQGNSLTQ